MKEGTQTHAISINLRLLPEPVAAATRSPCRACASVGRQVWSAVVSCHLPRAGPTTALPEVQVLPQTPQDLEISGAPFSAPFRFKMTIVRGR